MTTNAVQAVVRPEPDEIRPERTKISGDVLPFKTEKVDAAVHFINERTILSGLELAREVGEYVLKTFFDGDYANFSDPSRSKSTSFRSLLEREDLLLGSATIYNFVRISHQLKLMPAEVVRRLTLAQHRALLPLPDPERKEDLARQALDEGWSAEVLEVEVRKLLGGSRRHWKIRRSRRRPAPECLQPETLRVGSFAVSTTQHHAAGMV